MAHNISQQTFLLMIHVTSTDDAWIQSLRFLPRYIGGFPLVPAPEWLPDQALKAIETKQSFLPVILLVSLTNIRLLCVAIPVIQR